MRMAATVFVAVMYALYIGQAVAQTVPAATTPAASKSVELPDSVARQHFKRLPKEALVDIAREHKRQGRLGQPKTLPRQDAVLPSAAGDVQKIESITVYADSEDFVAPKPPPMLVFRATLDKQRPKTPEEITRGILCAIGLCAIDTSKERSIADRNEARARSPPSAVYQP